MSIKRFDESCMEGGGVAPHANGEYVKYADHIASHAYDEAKELAECRSQWEKNPNCLFSDMWIGWKACAKSSARSAE